MHANQSRSGHNVKLDRVSTVAVFTGFAFIKKHKARSRLNTALCCVTKARETTRALGKPRKLAQDRANSRKIAQDYVRPDCNARSCVRVRNYSAICKIDR